jgi:hypothetical protein
MSIQRTQNMRRTTGTSLEDPGTCMITSGLILLRMGRFQTKVIETIKTHILCSKIFFAKNRRVCEIMWKNIVQPDRPQMTAQKGTE